MDDASQPSADTVMGEAAGAAPAPAAQAGGGIDSIPATLSHGGRFIQYNIFGNIFEVTIKYRPPIMPIGKGAYGIVCSALNSETNEQVAIKKIANAFDNKIDAKRTLREIKLLRHMDHENVVAIRDIIPPPQRLQFNDVYIAYELMDTDLHQIIRSNQALSEEHCQYFLYQILRGLKYIHSANVLHRDLKPSNLLLNANCDLKICDFGLARITSETDFMTEYVVTRWYRAPELLLNSSEYSAAIDVWSVGCIFMELMDRKPLFPGRDHVHQLRLLMELIGTPTEADLECMNDNAKRYIRQLPRHNRQSLIERFPHVHPAAVDLVEKMLTFDPRQRITVEEALAHPYLASLHDISDEPVCSTPFSFDFEQHALSEDQIKDLIYQEALAFNPEYNQPVFMVMTTEQMDQILAIMRDMVTRRENPLARMNKDFEALNGKAFIGDGDVYKVQEWLLQCERVFREMDVSEMQKRKIAECQLTEDALRWWETHRKCLTEDVLRDLKWTQFKDMFSQQFVPRVKKHKYQKELLQVEQ